MSYRLVHSTDVGFAQRAAGGPPLRNGGAYPIHRVMVVDGDGAPLVEPTLVALLGVGSGSVIGRSPHDAARRGHAYARDVAIKAAALLPALEEERACCVRRAARASLRAALREDEDAEGDALFYAREIARLGATMAALRHIVAQVAHP